MNWNDYDAALFDLDGVLTPTAEIHMRAWDQMFTEYLNEHHDTARPYAEQDYFDYIDGKPRYDGVQSFLTSRGIELPQGDPDDPPSALTVSGLGNRKNELFTAIVKSDGIQAYPGSKALVQKLAARGIPMAIVSSSKNAPDVLRAAGIDRFLATVMHGGRAAELGLKGKPAPDTFLQAARDLGVDPSEAVVLEDAVSGVKAGKAGSFGLVIGVDRGAGDQALTDAGADLVVRDLEELL